MNIGILSDTHGLFRVFFQQELKKCDVIIHAGDIGTKTCYQELKAINLPLYMVRGNCDNGSYATYLPENLSFSIGGHLFYLIHDRNQLPYSLPETEYIIFGHTHCYEYETKRGITYINPGSASNSRGGGSPSIAVLTLNDNSSSLERICME